MAATFSPRGIWLKTLKNTFNGDSMLGERKSIDRAAIIADGTLARREQIPSQCSLPLHFHHSTHQRKRKREIFAQIPFFNSIRLTPFRARSSLSNPIKITLTYIRNHINGKTNDHLWHSDCEEADKKWMGI
jgi:hypothetical protein